MKNSINRLVLLGLLFLLAGCAGKLKVDTFDIGASVVLEETPYFPQRDYQCGPAALAMLLSAAGVDVHPEDLVPQTYIPGKKGSLQIELVAACRHNARIPYILDGHLSSIIDEIEAGRVVLVLQNIGLRLLPVYHYAVVIGVIAPDKLVLHSAGERRLLVDIDQFAATWQLAGSWAMTALSPGELPANPDPERYLQAVADFESGGHISESTEAYEAAISTWPDHQTALFALANNKLNGKHYQEAEALYSRLLLLNPDHIAALNNLAETLSRQGRYTEALAALDNAANVPGFSTSPFRQTVLDTLEEIKVLAGEVENKSLLPAE